MLQRFAAACLAALSLQSGTPQAIASETSEYLSFLTNDEAKTVEEAMGKEPPKSQGGCCLLM